MYALSEINLSRFITETISDTCLVCIANYEVNSGMLRLSPSWHKIRLSTVENAKSPIKYRKRIFRQIILAILYSDVLLRGNLIVTNPIALAMFENIYLTNNSNARVQGADW